MILRPIFASPPLPEIAASSGLAKILIVDDEPFNIDTLEQELQDRGYATVAASNGQEALAQVAAEAPDLVLLDIMMPVMDGFAVLARLKADSASRDIPVIVISALTDTKSAVRGIELGADDYLPKPFEPALLRARIASSLDKKRWRDQEKLYLRALERELEIGREIQASFLPATLPRWPGWDLAGRLLPARQVAGDFYDAFLMPKHHKIGLVIGDVCDKGVGAALFMALFRSLLMATANREEFAEGAEETGAVPGRSDKWLCSPEGSRSTLINAVTGVNNYVARVHGGSGMFASLFFGLLDPDTGSMAYVNGGHGPIYTLGLAGIKEDLVPTGPVVGLFSGVPFRIAEVTLDPGDTLIALTDGVADARDASGGEFSLNALEALLAWPPASATALLDRITEAVATHSAGSKQFDDITMLAVHRVAAKRE